MKTNMALVAVGFVLFTVGIYRLAPISLERKVLTGFLIQSVPLCLALLVVLIWTYKVGGGATLVKGLIGTFRVTSAFLPTIFFLFPVMAFGAVLASHYQAEINHMLEGAWGFAGTLFAAFVVPTANAVAGPIKICWSIPSHRPLILYFLTSAALVCWPVFFFRALGLTWEIGMQMYKVNWIVAVVILPGFWMWSRALTCGGWIKAAMTLVPCRSL